jgi:hypothetical protein
MLRRLSVFSNGGKCMNPFNISFFAQQILGIVDSQIEIEKLFF